MVVQRVHLTERRAHFADFYLQPCRKRCEGEEAFFQIHTMLTEADEEVGAGVGVNHFGSLAPPRRANVLFLLLQTKLQPFGK